VPNDDPFLRDEETGQLDTKNPEVKVILEIEDAAKSVKDQMRLIFDDRANADEPRGPDGIITYYSHQFALSGGDDMALDPGKGIYEQNPTYHTWFETAVRLIG